jgi:hypothetical protein
VKKTARAGKAPADPITLAKRERDAQLRELTDQAHGANLDLGHALMHSLTTVDPVDMSVAKFFVLCGGPHSKDYADCAAMPMTRDRPASRGSHTRPAGSRSCEEDERCPVMEAVAGGQAFSRRAIQRSSVALRVAVSQVAYR